MSEPRDVEEPHPDERPSPRDGRPFPELAFVAGVAATLVFCALLILIANR